MREILCGNLDHVCAEGSGHATQPLAIPSRRRSAESTPVGPHAVPPRPREDSRNSAPLRAGIATLISRIIGYPDCPVTRNQSTYFPQAWLSGTIRRVFGSCVAAITPMPTVAQCPSRNDGRTALTVIVTGVLAPSPRTTPTAKNGPGRPRYGGRVHRRPCAAKSSSSVPTN